MATPTPVPAPAPPQPRAAYVWLMRGGCYAFVAVLAGFAWYAPDWFLADLVFGLLFLALAVVRPAERHLKTTFEVSVIGFAVMLLALAILLFVNPFDLVPVVLVSASTVALLVSGVGAFLALRSVPKDAWVAQRPPKPAFDPAQVDRHYALLARAAALVAIAIAVYSAAITHVGFVFFAVLFCIPYLIFAVLPVRAMWVEWGKAMAWCMGVPLLLLTALGLSSFVTNARVTRSERHVLLFCAAILATQVAQLLFVQRAYRGRLPIGRAVAQSAIYFAIMLLLMAEAVPNFYADPKLQNATNAAGSLRAIETAAAAYQTQYPKAGYPMSLQTLAPPASGAPNPRQDAANLLDAELARGTKRGYRFTYRPVIKDGVVVHYSLTARPVEYDETGKESFYTDDGGVFHMTTEDREATANDPPL